ncbi:ACT domain-containing protein [Corynebacterium incognita]|uniref:ACT domain-containing protein n=1 Tax=Corynebacterium incognita TaxID=2754725 RepID=A0A7G7CR79_9CORY|nr:ACT domain-containing protein [Corynebacterium incognita]QNE90095.1 ACT domain-containing protein [Corynebacterium incognita]
MNKPARTKAVISTSGPDKPGISSAFFRVLASNGVELVDAEQSIIRGRITLVAFVNIDTDRIDVTREGLTNTLSVYSHNVFVEAGDDVERGSRARSTHSLVLFAPEISAHYVFAVAQTLADFDVNIDRIRGTARTPLTAIELYLTVPHDDEGVRAELATLAQRIGLTISMSRFVRMRAIDDVVVINEPEGQAPAIEESFAESLRTAGFPVEFVDAESDRDVSRSLVLGSGATGAEVHSRAGMSVAGVSSEIPDALSILGIVDA